jgi:RNA polymerase sigma-70 factor, ECF subfamily
MACGDDAPDDLMERLKRGDAQALGELFSRHRERLWRMVNFRLDPRLCHRLDADDVLQESYINASKRIEHVFADASASPFLWLRMIVTQTLIDLSRRHLGAQRRDAHREVHGFDYPQATSTSLAACLAGNLTSPSQKAMRAEMAERLEQALEGMDPIDQEVLALRHFEELTNGEVARVLGIQEKAASIRYVRALKRLKDVLAQVPGFPDEDPAGRRIR